MKRRVLMLALFLVLGAIVNVAVAWGCAAWWLPRFQKMEAADRSEAIRWWKQTAPRTFPSFVGDCFEASNAGYSIFSIRFSPDSFRSERHRSGWPVRCLERAVWTDFMRRERWHEDAWIVDVDRKPIPILPLAPIWPGFAINTVFYAAVLWLVFAAPFALRKRRRIKRGLCPKCAYPVGTNEVCTECGAAVSPSPSGGGRGQG